MTMDFETLAAKPSVASPYDLLFQALTLIPTSHYFVVALFISLAFMYSFLEIHFLHHLRTLFRGDHVTLTYNSCSHLCQSLVSNCTILRGRYRPTPWLSSPHLQTAFLSLFGKAPSVAYRRQLFIALDGGTITLDWLTYSDIAEGSSRVIDNSTAIKRDKTPIVIVIPGLTSDSSSPYAKYLAFNMARNGWNVAVSNHRGLGGVSLTSDCFYNAGWTEDLRKIIDHIHCEYPEAPLFSVGTSIGANILVKYLGEDGTNTLLDGAAAICSPWDLLICDRFINRRPMQKIYDRVLTLGLQGYAQMHRSILSRLADWERIKKSSSVRDFDNHATRVLGKFETVDTFYRRSSSINYVEHVSVPLLCISALDDPVCTSEVIPWDECRVNENIILATTQHGGHLAFYEGITASSLWWVRAVDEFFGVLSTNPYIKESRKRALPCSIDEGLHMNVMGDGSVTTMGSESERLSSSNEHATKDEETNSEEDKQSSNATVQGLVDKLSLRRMQSMWLLAQIVIITIGPFVGSLILSVLKRRFKTLFRK
ncbi:embryogenesis-associated protein EMB8-like [Hibiscus syriacus]|uniref:embryogenesis-associated protein EMB8-like n=1 Tax=Hibiscus syriacus TaxID=106335 RepID=UPI001921138C|nr:embryogenesis-associated protein EMB8-like [Hibiscus syriacus]